MRVLVACEISDKVRGAFEKQGFDAWSCDILPSKNKNNKKHIIADVVTILDDGWDVLIGFPPCTYLADSGLGWLYHPDDKHLPVKKRRPHPLYPNRREQQQQAIDFFMTLWNCKIPFKSLENPKGIMQRVFKKPTQVIHPFYFGDPFRKYTCLWLDNLPPLVHYPDDDIFGNKKTWVADKGERVRYNGRLYSKWQSNLSANKRQEVRSETFPGIANAMALQWGTYLKNL